MPTNAVNRGTLSPIAGRFATIHVEQDSPPGPRPTRYHREIAKSVISRNRSPDVPFSQSINPYRGCEHGCVYCYARPNHAYVDLSPGQDFESEIFCKENIGEVLRDELRKPSYHCEPVLIGSATDPYQPIERERRLTREVLQVLSDTQHPFSLITKSALVLRDIDLIAPMARAGLASITVSVTTLDNRLKAQLEPRASAGSDRLKAIRELSRAGVPVNVLVAPVIPFINDHELEDVIAQASGAGAQGAGFVVLRLPHEVGALWQEWLQSHYPDRADKVMSVVRQLHGGANYDSRWHLRQTGQGAWAHLLRQRFEQSCRAAGLAHSGMEPLRVDQFVPPGPLGQLGFW